MRGPHAVIIGAGPAGLAAAAGLARRGVAYTLVERGAAPAAALRAVDPDMELFSPARLSRLRGMELPHAGRYPTFRELVAALDRFVERHAIAVQTGLAVTAVERDAGGDRGGRGDFVVRTDAGALRASHVINATGLAGAPRLPEGIAALRLPWKHSLEVRRPDLQAARRLLVVGAGASAADVLKQWLAVRRPGDRAWIAARSPIRALPSTVLGVDFHYWLWAIEHLPGRWLAPPRDPIWGLEVPRAIRGGAIERIQVARYREAAVELAGDAEIEPDLIVFATGFHHDTRHLGGLIERDAAGWPIAQGCESRCARGIFVLGARYGRSIASPTLRGIARDAEAVCARIAGAP
jgi:putative flavoprotein involved in K+ transport